MKRTWPLVIILLFAGCAEPEKEHTEEVGALSRTEFTDRVENFFEYTPLKSGATSRFLIHLTDLNDGTPVEEAKVNLTIRENGSGNVVSQIESRVGRVTGIYVADVTISKPGNYNIEFHIKNNKLDERLPLTDFKVE